MIDITGIVEAVFNVILALAAVALAYLKSKSDRDAQIDAWVKIAVQAAEQAYKTGMTQDRKKYAMDVLSKKGLKLNWSEVDMMIESAVNQLPPARQKIASESMLDGRGV